jgi:ubiquinol-cytochrome c reductase iron-sulfur subunit
LISNLDGTATVASASTEEPTRRDFLFIATGAMGVVGVAAVITPLVSSMAPDARTRALNAPIEVDLGSVQEGDTVILKWKGRPVFVRNRSQAEIDRDSKVADADMKDPAPDTARVPQREGKPQLKWVVVLGACTHLGCVPNKNSGEFGGWACPCHGSQFDTVGRIRKGPAARNLDMLPVTFLSDTLIRIG